MVLARPGGPQFLPSEVARLGYLAGSSPTWFASGPRDQARDQREPWEWPREAPCPGAPLPPGAVMCRADRGLMRRRDRREPRASCAGAIGVNRGASAGAIGVKRGASARRDGVNRGASAFDVGTGLPIVSAMLIPATHSDPPNIMIPADTALMKYFASRALVEFVIAFFCLSGCFASCVGRQHKLSGTTTSGTVDEMTLTDGEARSCSCGTDQPGSAGRRAVLQKSPEPVLVEDRHPECDGLVELRPRCVPGHHERRLLDTEPAALPPRMMMASLASSRENPASEPVTTMVRPASVGSMPLSRSSAIFTPAARHFSTIARCQSTSNHSRSLAAMVGPTPSTSASCCSPAAMMASRSPNAAASARAAVGPTWRMDECHQDPPQRPIPGLLEVGQQPFGVRRQLPALVRKKSACISSSPVSENRSPSSVMTPA